jgi:CheY-like chemotaxis protein
MKNKKILFIEDEYDQIMVLKMRLEANGFEVVYAQDGIEGLQKVSSEKPDVVLLDLILPNMDGFEICRRLKSSALTSDIPVIIISAVGIKDIEQKCIAHGADDYITKPYDSALLLNKIKLLLHIE